MPDGLVAPLPGGLHQPFGQVVAREIRKGQKPIAIATRGWILADNSNEAIGQNIPEFLDIVHQPWPTSSPRSAIGTLTRRPERRCHATPAVVVSDLFDM